MSYSFRDRNQSRPKKPRLDQSKASAFDVVWLSIKLLFTRIQFWIFPNFLEIVFSLGIVTGPAAKAAFYHTIAMGLRDPAGSSVKAFPEMKVGFKRFFWKSLLISIIKLVSLLIILISIYVWVRMDILALRFLSIFAFYALTLWWISVGYLYPVLVENPEQSVKNVIRESFLLGFKRPFQSLLFAFFNTLFLILGLGLLGPILLIIPALRGIIFMQGYWFLTGRKIPGFMEIHEYINQNTD